MNREYIIEMLEAEWRDRLKAAVLAERESCIKIVKNEAWQYTSPVWAVEIINDIRDRGQE